MNYRKIISLVLCFLLSSFVFASEAREVELKNLTVRTNITGQAAQTEVTLELYNPNSRILEYELEYPLNHSQRIVGFALDVDNQFIDAVAVEKPKAESVFEDVVRKNVDPALLKKTSGDNYKIRIYPINPGRTRKVKITLFQFLNKAEDGYLYVLDSVGKFEKAQTVNIIVNVSESLPVSSESCAGNFNFRYVRNNHSYISTIYGEDVFFKENILQITVPETEKNCLSLCEYEGSDYFLYQTEYKPENTYVPDFESNPLLILWDASLSEEKNLNDNLKFLSDFFNQFRNIAVSLVVFRNTGESPVDFMIENGNWRDLREHLRNIIYDGSASYDFMSDLASFENAVLFSDGNDLFSKNEDNRIPAENIFCICSGLGSNVKKLERLVSFSKGSVIELKNNTSSGSVQLEVSEKPAVVYSENADDVFTELRGNRLLLSGIINNAQDEVVVLLNSGKEIRFSPDNYFVIRCLPKIWATYKIDSLSVNERIHKSEISKISKKFSVPTDTMSLIVLESAADYLEYGIEPPQLFREEYERLLKIERNKHERSLSNLKTEWDRYVKWWQTDFPKGEYPVSKVINYETDDLVYEMLDEEAFHAADGYVADDYAADDYAADEVSAARMFEPSYESAYAAESYESNAVSEKSAVTSKDTGGKIFLQKWNGDSEISERIRNSDVEEAYYIYLDARDDFSMSAGFYLECAELLGEKGLNDESICVLSTLAEIAGEDRSVLRLLANKLIQLGDNVMAEKIFRQILEISPDEPQSYLDLAYSLRGQGKNQEAIETMYKIISSDNMRYFAGIPLMTLKEINSVIFSMDNPDVSFMDPYFIKDLPLDLRIVLSWDTDDTDIDLHVIDPNNEETYYGHKQSYQGGLNSADNTSGFGPEDYSLKEAKNGTYRVEVNFYGNRQQKISDGTHIYLDFYTDWGKKNQQKKSVMLKLKDRGSSIYVGEIQIDN